MGPALMPTVPGFIAGQLCMAKMDCTGKRSNNRLPSSRGHRQTLFAPAGTPARRCRRSCAFPRVARGADQHGGVAVWPQPCMRGPVCKTSRRSRCARSAAGHPCRRAGPPCCRWPCCAPRNDAHHAGAPDAVVDLIHTAELQRFLDAFAGVESLQNQLGMGVQVTPRVPSTRGGIARCARRRDHPLSNGALHQWPPALPTRRRGSTANYSRVHHQVDDHEDQRDQAQVSSHHGMSANVTAWMNSRPMPGHWNTVSVMMAKAIRPPVADR